MNSDNFRLRLNYIHNKDKLYKVFRAYFIEDSEKVDDCYLESLVVILPELGLNPIERVPDTLVGLIEYFNGKDIDLNYILTEKIKKIAGNNGISFYHRVMIHSYCYCL